ncbi:MAG TPA: phenylalanine--tRNA ligase subunit alpha, partial [Clostridiales bacterium]|nr:phenylalanine--tRNA ligase subunit alpha [Clostridiales bacterium]
MKEKLEQIRLSAQDAIQAAQSIKDLEEIRIKYLGKKGELTAVLRGMGSLSAEERPLFGKIANEVRSEIEELLEKALRETKEKEKMA